MRKQKYTVTFIDGDNLTIYADTPIQALFLASARKIENGQSYGVDSVFEDDTKRFFVSKKENLQLKDFDVDYWIITFHAPNSGRLDGLFVLTAMPFLLTLGFFPTISSAETESTFWIFDKELNLLKNVQYQDRFYSITSWLAFGGTVEGFGTSRGIASANIYEPDIKQFSKELVSVLKK